MGTPAQTLILVNPAAGNGRARRAQPHVAEYLRSQGFPADFVVSQSAEDLRRRAAEAAAAGYASIVALGGDGAFQQVVKETLGTGVILGFLPAGGGNDVARGLGLPNDPVAAAHVFLRSRPRPVDVLRARFADGRTGVYVGGGGLGLDAEAAQLANGKFRRLPGAARYIASVLGTLSSFRPFDVEMEIDGKPAGKGGPLLLAAVANTPTYGAGFKIAPAAAMDDGLLDVILVSQLSWVRLVELIPVMLQTGNVRGPEIRRLRGRRVRFRPDRPMFFHGDGEVLGETPVEIETLPGAIRVVAPVQP